MSSFRSLRPAKTVSVALALVLCTSACLDRAQKAKVRRLVPARMHMAHLKSVALVEFDGEGGDAVANSIEQRLITASPWHVVDRQHLRQVLDEQGLWGQSYSQASKVGNLIGADVLIVGSVSAHRVDEDFSWDSRYTNTGSAYTLYSRTGQVFAAATLRGIHAATGAVLGIATLDASSTLSTDTVRIDDAAQPSPDYLLQLFAPLDEAQLLADADRKLAQAFFQTILPHEEMSEVSVYADARIRESMLAIEALERGDFVAAVALYEAGIKQADRYFGRQKLKARARYNLGVALGCQGRFDEAAAMVQQANLLNRDPLFSDYLKTLQDYRRDAAELSLQARDWREVGP